MATTAPTAPVAWRTSWGEVTRLCVTTALAVAVLLSPALLDHPPTQGRLAVLAAGDGLSLLLEGAGGGRVLVAGGDAQIDAAAVLGRYFWPWDRRLDLLIVPDGRALPGAVELVRHGDVRAVAVLPFQTRGAETPALAALRAACAQRGLTLRVLEGQERVQVGQGGRLALLVGPDGDDQAGLRLLAGDLVTAVYTSGAAVVEPARWRSCCAPGRSHTARRWRPGRS